MASLIRTKLFWVPPNLMNPRKVWFINPPPILEKKKLEKVKLFETNRITNGPPKLISQGRGLCLCIYIYICIYFYFCLYIYNMLIIYNNILYIIYIYILYVYIIGFIYKPRILSGRYIQELNLVLLYHLAEPTASHNFKIDCCCLL